MRPPAETANLLDSASAVVRIRSLLVALNFPIHPVVDPPSIDTSRWFLTEVQPHRPALRAWLLARFPSLPDVDDIVQESFARVLQARETATIRSTRALLFATARNLALDAVRRQRIARFEPITDETDSFVLIDDTDVVAFVSQHEELELLTQAIQSLPARCRQIMTLRTDSRRARSQRNSRFPRAPWKKRRRKASAPARRFLPPGTDADPRLAHLTPRPQPSMMTKSNIVGPQLAARLRTQNAPTCGAHSLGGLGTLSPSNGQGAALQKTKHRCHFCR